MQDNKERVNHHLTLMSNKDDDNVGGGGDEVEVFRSKVKYVSFFLSLEAEQMNGRLFATCFIGQN